MKLLFTLAARYLSGRKLRTVLTTSAIVFGVLVIFGMNTLLPAVIRGFTTNAMAIAGEVDATITGKAGDAFPAGVLDQVRSVPGVVLAAGSLQRVVNLPADYYDHDASAPDRVSAVSLIGIDPQTARSIAAYRVLQGRFLEAGDRDAAVIADSLAKVAGVALGEEISVPTPAGVTQLSVVGILPQRLMPGNEEVLVSLTRAQELFGARGQINVIDANFDSVDETRRAGIESAVRSALGPGYTIGVLQSGAEILNNIQTIQVALTLFGSLGLLMGAFIIFNTFRTIIAERRRDIAMLRAVGASRGTISRLIVIEGLIQGVLGTAVGMLLGYLFGVLVLAVIGPVTRQYINIDIGLPIVTPGVILLSTAMGIGITLLAGLLPAREAGRVTPIEALRPSVGAVSLRRMAGVSFWAGLAMIAVAMVALISGSTAFIAAGSALFTIGLILISPAVVHPIARLFGALLALLFARDGTAQLAAGNLSRKPGRAATTAATTMIALAVLVMAATILSSITISFDNMLRNSLASDFMLVPPSVSLWGSNTGARPELAQQIRQIDGVAVVSTLRFASTEMKGVSVGLLGIDVPAYTQTGGLTFTSGDAANAYKALQEGRAMLINGPLAASAGLKIGDEVSALTARGEVQYRIAGIASDFLNSKTTTGYISHASMAADFDRTEDVFFQINVKPGASLPAVQRGIDEALKPYPQFRLVPGAEFRAQNAGLFNAAFGGLYAMMAFLSIPSLIATLNTLAIGVIERTREIGMLRAVGATRRQVRRAIVAEALILAGIGTSFGLLSGLYLGKMAVGAFVAIGFPIDYLFPAEGVIIGAAVGMLFGALAALLPAKQAAGMNLVQALRYE